MQNGEVILDITLSLKPGNQKDIEALMKDLNQRRATKQPLEKRSAGSTFKRPDGHFVGQMLEELGLKGFSVGDAQVSEKHAGFLINNGRAPAKTCSLSSIRCSRRSKRPMAWICIPRFRS